MLPQSYLSPRPVDAACICRLCESESECEGSERRGDLAAWRLLQVKKAMLHNTLVCLPTGLGKTLIASVVMFNFYR